MWLIDAYICQQIRPSLVQIMAFCLLSDIISISAGMAYCLLDPFEQIWGNHESKYNSFHTRKFI